jgi:hypothetical protein
LDILAENPDESGKLPVTLAVYPIYITYETVFEAMSAFFMLTLLLVI